MPVGALVQGPTDPGVRAVRRAVAGGPRRAEPLPGPPRRHPDPVQDAALKADLASSLKDRAENIMIVDLLRNDLSHFALPGSLCVPRLCEIESYATVHQMVSTIEAGSSTAMGTPSCSDTCACPPSVR